MERINLVTVYFGIKAFAPSSYISSKKKALPNKAVSQLTNLP
ncbi:hypothetical protein COO91_07490 [Nostoc flagelliforme CCNUN1]|uniref:Uncharacterized protein n=1 Tax=Nostoc flagelliforme CCNUN1 TaxID=2038116 RepID=A0A2K8T179_9NOSO|nr:hypothetical protein COO91_07490 [Nostoc flagelliforme CCNUN1]